MGSFFSSCSLSSMTLSHQETSVQLLVRTPLNSENLEPKNMIVSNNLSQSFYSPFAFPIKGKYSDYGYIEDIQKDHNTDILEKYFNMTIEDIIRNIGSDGYNKDIKNEKFYNSLSLTYFRTEILEYLEKDWGEIENKKYKHYETEARFLKFLKYTFGNEKKDEIKKVLNSIKKDKSKEEISEISKKITKLYMYKDSIYQYLSCSRQSSTFELLDITKDFKEDVIKQFTFLRKLDSIGKYLIPSLYGKQEQNFKELYDFNEKVNDVLIKDMSINNFYDYDEVDDINNLVLRHERNKNIQKVISD